MAIKGYLPNKGYLPYLPAFALFSRMINFTQQMCLFFPHSSMTSALLIASARNPSISGSFEADRQEEFESPGAFLLACGVWSQINDWASVQNPMKYL